MANLIILISFITQQYKILFSTPILLVIVYFINYKYQIIIDADYIITLFVFTLIILPAFMIYNFIFQKPTGLLKKKCEIW